jgi:hypothetical protein
MVFLWYLYGIYYLPRAMEPQAFDLCSSCFSANSFGCIVFYMYYLFGMYYLTLIEKDGKRTMIKEMENTWKECEISDLDMLEDWNVWHFPSKEKRTPPVLGY